VEVREDPQHGWMNTRRIAMEKLLKLSEKMLGEKYASCSQSSKKVSEEKGFDDTETLVDKEAKESQ
jgi:hypothetical protein